MLRRETLHVWHIKLVICKLRQTRCKQKKKTETADDEDRANGLRMMMCHYSMFAHLAESMFVFMEIFSCFNYENISKCLA